MKKTPYQKLLEISKQAATLESIAHLLEWDQETYLPKEAIDFRSTQSELLASLIHKERTSKKYAKALQLAHHDSTLTTEQKAALREWQRDYNKTAKLTTSFVKAFAETTSKSIHVWGIAKKENDFSSFAPYLEKIVKLCRKKCELLGYTEHPYDALLDLYEPEMTTSKLSSLFGRLKPALTAFVKQIGQHPLPNQQFLHDDFPHDKQIQFSHEILRAMGFDPSTSRLDLSNHPFCVGIHPSDTRMTTHVNTNFPGSCIFSVIHEGGHGLYNMGHPAAHFGSPLCESVSMGIEESQSRFWETTIGHSLPFWTHFYSKLQKEFPQLQNISLQDFYRAINTVKPSLIRIESDEVTYSLHIIVRFELEKALIEGSLKVKDLPDAWNEKYQSYLGITPPTNSQGCMQDIHWSMGGFGYFPSYSLGNLYAAQFFQTFQHTFPNWKEKVSAGDLSFIRMWLHDNIHQYGRQYTPSELIVRISGKSLSEEPFLEYLNTKYKSL